MLIILLILSILCFIYVGGFFYWCGYLIIMVYLGGLLILFVYFTSTISFFKKITFLTPLLVLIGLLLLVSFVVFLEKDQKMGFNSEGGFMVFTRLEGSGPLCFILLLLSLILVLIRFFRKLSAPLRQQ